MCKSSPDQLAVPDAAIGSAWKDKAEFIEPFNYAVGAALSCSNSLKTVRTASCTS